MSKKRRILTLLLAVALATILVACDAGDEEDADAQPQATATVVVEEPAEPGTSAELEAESEPVEAEEEEAPAEETVADAALLQDSESDESLSEEQAAQDPEVIAALEGTLHEIYEEVSPSVVHIQVVAEGSAAQVPQFPGFTPPQQGPQFGEGSGFVWDEQGHIVTNNHVVDGATTINVIFTNGLSVPATVVGADADSDLAVLSVDAPDELLDPVRMGDSTAVEVGELAVAIGNPFGQEGSLTVGVISALGRLLPVQAGTMGGPTYSIPDIIQTDASINPGNSGGVLLNDQGEVIGVTTAIISPARVSAGIGFAIPSRIVEQVVPVLIEEGKYQHPYLGIRGTELTPALAEAMNLPANLRGALVVGLTPEGPAADAGLQSSEGTATVNGIEVPVGGDVIIAIEGEPVTSMDDLVTQLARLGEVGETITLTVLRDGEEQQIEVTLEARPDAPVPERQAVQNVWMGILGTTLTPPVAEAMNLPADQMGVLIGEVVSASPADEAGLRGSATTAIVNGQEMLVGGDVIVAVNGEQVSDMMTLQQILAQYAAGDEVTLTVLRDGEQMEVSLTLAPRPQ